MLSAYRRVSFSGNGTSTQYTLPEQDVSNATAKVNGVTTSITLNSSTGVATFSTAPATGTDNVEITYMKNNVTTNTEICKNKYEQSYGLAQIQEYLCMVTKMQRIEYILVI